MRLRFTLLVVALAAHASTALAQAPAPAKAPNANAIIDTKDMTPEQRSAAILAQYGEPVLDPQSAQRTEEAIKRYKTIAAKGGWPLVPAEAKYAVGAEGPDVELLRRRLVVTGDLFTVESSGPYNDELIGGVKRFQLRNGLLATGLVGPRTLAALNVPVEKRIQQLEASLQRMQAIDFKFGERYVVVNIPAAYAEAVEGDKVVRRYRVVVGKSEKPSPTVTSQINNVNLNPTWTVPSSITQHEISARMRKDPGYLARMHMQVLDGRGNALDPASIDWNEGKVPDVTVRQDPGEWNALGRVRIDMPNSYAVYMHDTNQRNLFANDYRFDSHGCVRVDNVRDLAAWLLKDTANWDRTQIDLGIATGLRQDIRLSKSVPVAWVYLTAWMARDGIVQFRNDVYDQDAQLNEAAADIKAFLKPTNEPVTR
ncbi:murein L,D-transpeptidase [Rhodopseudomonas boonkerdii]|uniref:L,D-transpeptidase family protein n=1 Tax=Rhodopseudomonas boonkerdii TaxID=475937 RepID=UPI001E2BD363|nr:L,D-transpeptidase family protein [Rhodopseudomonas boonkerdii]UGV26015.1 murein L,D-transpeptidase [Rhodopseudomonas boonkerdii]